MAYSGQANFLSDLECVRLTQEGKLEAYDQIVARYQSTMTALLYRFARDRTELEDLVQETFVRAWRALPRWQPEKPLVHWLKRIAVNVGLEYCRKHQRSPFSKLVEPPTEEDHAETALENLASTDSTTDASDAADEAAYLLSYLEAEDRVLLSLLYLEQMPMQEIAEHFGWSRIKAKVRAFRARKQLRTLLSHHGYTFP